ncbi:MAG: YdcF family protein [Mycobacterium sp.]
MLVIAGLSGYLWLGRVREDPLQRADAVIVLAGAHDGRESYGLEVARQVSAGTLVLSDGYPAEDPVMRRACTGPRGDVMVICRRADLATTRGEALMARTLAAERHWQRIVVVSWSYHLPRARFIFSHCYSNRPDAVIMRAVPHDDSRSLAEWEYISLYQEFAFIKAGVEGACG